MISLLYTFATVIYALELLLGDWWFVLSELFSLRLLLWMVECGQLLAAMALLWVWICA